VSEEITLQDKRVEFTPLFGRPWRKPFTPIRCSCRANSNSNVRRAERLLIKALIMCAVVYAFLMIFVPSSVQATMEHSNAIGPSRRRHPRPKLKTLESGDRRPFHRRRRLGAFDQSALDGLGIDQVREAIRGNRVSFPSQVPIFESHDRPDLQRKLVQLYFVCGWTCETVVAWSGLSHKRVRQILTKWKRRAVAAGYVQVIPAAPWSTVHRSAGAPSTAA
jgi:hypothetical protein